MNQDKAREYFSGYYENTLERGLRQTLDQRMRADAQLLAEYHAFQQTMDHLDQLRFEEIEVPAYLSDRIATHIEEAQAAARPKNPFLVWLPRYGVAALAAAAVLFAVVSWWPGHGGAQTSGVVGLPAAGAPTWPNETISVAPGAHSATIHYQSALARSVRVLDVSGQQLGNNNLASGQALTLPLNNPNKKAALFEVRVSNAGPDEYVEVPGTQTGKSATDTGTVAEFVKALGDRYSVPVILNTRDLTSEISWSLDAPDAKTAAQKSLDSQDYDVTQTASGVVSISAK